MGEQQLDWAYIERIVRSAMDFGSNLAADYGSVSLSPLGLAGLIGRGLGITLLERRVASASGPAQRRTAAVQLDAAKSAAADVLLDLHAALTATTGRAASASDTDFPERTSAADTGAAALAELATHLPDLCAPRHIAGALIALAAPPQLLHTYVAQHAPYILLPLLRDLLTVVSVNGNNTNTNSYALLFSLATSDPPRAPLIRALLVDHRAPLPLVLHLTWHYCDDHVLFLSGLLANETSRNWLHTFLEKSAQAVAGATGTATAGAAKYRDPLVQELWERLMQSVKAAKTAPVTWRCAVLRLLCFLTGILGLKMLPAEAVLCMELVNSVPAEKYGAGTTRYLELAMCFMLSCAHLAIMCKNEIAQWGQSLLSAAKASNASSHFEMLLLVTIHMHSNQTASIADLVRRTLSAPVQLHGESLAMMAQLFVNEIFTVNVVGRFALGVNVTANLSTQHVGFLPIHCIYQLLNASVQFETLERDCLVWIYHQLQNCALPVHPLMPAVMEIAATSSSYSLLPFDERNVASMFASSSRNFATEVLVLYHVLCRLELAQKPVNSSANTRGKRKHEGDIRCYSPQLITSLPIRSVLHRAQSEPANYGNILPPLLAISIRLFPQLFDAGELLSTTLRLELDQISGHIPSSTLPLTLPEIHRAFENVASEASHVHALLGKLCHCHDEILLPLLEPVCDVLLPRLFELSEQLSAPLERSLSHLWEKLSAVSPRRLWLVSINAIRDRKLRPAPFLQNELVYDPLLVMQCDMRIFSMPQLFANVFLRVLRAYLRESRAQLEADARRTQLEQKSLQDAVVAEVNEMSSTLINSQECVAIQTLLEICLRNQQRTAAAQPTIKRYDITEELSIESAVCAYIHESFISNPLLIKLIHFQCYDLALLPLTVKHIPSMHVCLDYIPELLQQPSLPLQCFAARLGAALAVQYPMQSSLNVCRDILAMIRTVLCHPLVEAVSSERMLPALVDIFRAFPSLADEVVAVLTAARAKNWGSNDLRAAVDDAFRQVSHELFVMS